MTINRYKLQVAAKGIDPALGKEYHHAESLFYSIGKTRFDSPPTHTHFHSTLQGPNSQHYHSSLSLFFPEGFFFFFKYVILSLKYPKSIYFSLVFLSSSPLNSSTLVYVNELHRRNCRPGSDGLPTAALKTDGLVLI